MTKRAIYLDERERDLARRVFSYVIGRLKNNVNDANAVQKFALSWANREVSALFVKFEELTTKEPEDETDPA